MKKTGNMSNLEKVSSGKEKNDTSIAMSPPKPIPENGK